MRESSLTSTVLTDYPLKLTGGILTLTAESPREPLTHYFRGVASRLRFYRARINNVTLIALIKCDHPCRSTAKKNRKRQPDTTVQCQAASPTESEACKGTYEHSRSHHRPRDPMGYHSKNSVNVCICVCIVFVHVYCVEVTGIKRSDGKEVLRLETSLSPPPLSFS